MYILYKLFKNSCIQEINTTVTVKYLLVADFVNGIVGCKRLSEYLKQKKWSGDFWLVDIYKLKKNVLVACVGTIVNFINISFLWLMSYCVHCIGKNYIIFRVHCPV